MPPTPDWTRIQEIFDDVVDLPPDQRDRALDRLCGNDRQLRSRIARLVRADSGAHGVLDTPAEIQARWLFNPLQDPDMDTGPPPLTEGARVGPYRIIDLIAHGGMGSVYRAERADGAYQQRVALKVVRASHLVGDLERRFLRERQILARLQHPGIARLLDGGVTTEGSPYLAMELVEGLPFTRWADQHNIDIEGRLRAFLEVCDAVQYAHRNLIVHRDLKPSNILVTEQGRVRLLDFGIARLLEADGPADAASEPVTRTGMLLMTPEYASPELIRGEPVTTAMDVYALGAILYELLTGARPFSARSGSLIELAARLEQEPAPPSRSPKLDARRSHALVGDLDTIALHALQNDAARRYPSVEALADDVRRHLDGLPVAARPDAWGYRAAKYVNRHRAGVAAAAALVLTLLGGLATTLWQARATRVEAARAQAVSAFLFSLFESADPYQNLGEVPNAITLLDRGAARIDSLGAGAGPEVRVDLLTTLGRLYANLGAFDRSTALLERAVGEATARFGANERTGAALDALAVTLIEAGQLDSAQAVAARGLAVRERAHVADTLLAASHSTLGTIASGLGQFDDAATNHRMALELDRRALSGDHPRIKRDLNNLGLTLEEISDFDESERMLREGLDMSRRLFGETHPDVATAYQSLAHTLGNKGELAAAEDLYRRGLAVNRAVYGESHPEVARSLDQLGLWIDRQGRHAEADSLYQVALAIRIATLGEDHLDVGATLNNIATLRYREGDYAGAVEAQERALAIWLRAYGPNHSRVAVAINNLGAMQLRSGDLDGAETNLSRALEIRLALVPQDLDAVGASYRNLGDLRRQQGRFGDAAALYDKAITVFTELVGPDYWRVADAQLGRGAALVELDRPAEALPALEDALRIRSKTFVANDLRIQEARLWLGAALARLGRTSEARPLLESARNAFAAAMGDGDPNAERAVLELRLIQAR